MSNEIEITAIGDDERSFLDIKTGRVRKEPYDNRKFEIRDETDE